MEEQVEPSGGEEEQGGGGGGRGRAKVGEEGGRVAYGKGAAADISLLSSA